MAPLTPIPGTVLSLPQCYAHSGLCERIEQLAGDVRELRAEVQHTSRRILVLSGEDGHGGEIGGHAAGIRDLEDARRALQAGVNRLAWKLAAAAIGGGSIIPLLQHYL